MSLRGGSQWRFPAIRILCSPSWRRRRGSRRPGRYPGFLRQPRCRQGGEGGLSHDLELHQERARDGRAAEQVEAAPDRARSRRAHCRKARASPVGPLERRPSRVTLEDEAAADEQKYPSKHAGYRRSRDIEPGGAEAARQAEERFRYYPCHEGENQERARHAPHDLLPALCGGTGARQGACSAMWPTSRDPSDLRRLRLECAWRRRTGQASPCLEPAPELQGALCRYWRKRTPARLA